MDNTPPSSFDINILPPHGANKFFVAFKSKLLTDEETEKLNMQVMTLLLDFANKRIMMVMEHAGIAGFLKIVQAVTTHDFELQVNMLDGQTGNSLDSLTFDIRCNKHEFVLDHNSNDIAKHVLMLNIL